jgi:tRNA pseudouridine55 synthase
MVTGVLPLCLGRSTRLVEYIQDLPKQYEAELTLGVSTDTEDWTGQIVEQVDAVAVTEAQIFAAVQSFQGEIEQVPPMYSALKQNGVKLVDLARQGIEVERKARKVTIYSIECLSIDLTEKQPKIRFRADCSKGTYIRTLCVDIGRKLGVPAMMSRLVRTQSGPFRKEDCITIDQLRAIQTDDSAQQQIVSEEKALQHFNKVHVPNWAALKLVQGQTLHRTRFDIAVVDGMGDSLTRVYDEQNRFVGLFQIDPQTGNMIAIKVFATADQWATPKKEQ